jgi:hypothetical protein
VIARFQSAVVLPTMNRGALAKFRFASNMLKHMLSKSRSACHYRKLRPDGRTLFDQLVQTDGRVLTDPTRVCSHNRI